MYVITVKQRSEKMTSQQKKDKILLSIAARGWFTGEIYLTEALELKSDGLIKSGERFSVGGNRKSVWVAA